MFIFSLNELYLHDLRDFFQFERRLVRSLRDAPASISSPRLVSAAHAHSDQAATHAELLRVILCRHGASPRPASERAPATMLTVAEQALLSTGDPDLHDAVLVAFLRRTTHHELAACRTAMARAKTLMLGLDRHSLVAILAEKTAGDAELDGIEAEVNQLALMVSTPAYV